MNYRDTTLAHAGSDLAPALPLDIDGYRSEGGDGFSFHQAPQAGDLAPDAALLTETGNSVRLFDQLRTPGFTLLLLSGIEHTPEDFNTLLGVAEQVKAQFGQGVKNRLILSGSLPDQNLNSTGNLLQDSKHQAHKLYGAKVPSLYLVRPDGYIAFRGQLEPVGNQVKSAASLIPVTGNQNAVVTTKILVDGQNAAAGSQPAARALLTYLGRFIQPNAATEM